jgi:hypothetical protein
MLSVNPDPDQVSTVIRDLALKSTATLCAYWLAVTGDRDDYAARLRPELASEGMPVLIIRRERFDNPNSLMTDIVHVLSSNRPAVLAALARNPNRINIVLLARTELAMGQSSSPVTWPRWVPAVGGKEVACFITDVTRRIDVPFGGVDSSRVNRALYMVESALVRRLVQVSARAPEQQAGFFDAIAKRGDVSCLAFLAGARKALREVTDTDAYRPAMKKGGSVTSRLWEIAQSGSGDGLDSAADELARAMQIPAEASLEGWREGLFGALARGHHPGDPLSRRFARDIIVTVSAACRFITCRHHSDEYPSFPVNLLVATIDDLYRSLAGIEACLNRFEDEALKEWEDR